MYKRPYFYKLNSLKQHLHLDNPFVSENLWSDYHLQGLIAMLFVECL